MERPPPKKMVLLWEHVLVNLTATKKKKFSDIKVCDGMLYPPKTARMHVIMQSVQVGFSNTD